MSILFPPICYIATIQLLENHYHRRYSNELQNIYIGNTQPLLEGRATLIDAINKNIDAFLRSKSIFHWGLKIQISVYTQKGTILYPAVFDAENSSLSANNPIDVAAENYRMMNEGLVVKTDLQLEHNTLLSNIILAFYICLSVLMLYVYYKRGLTKAAQEEAKKSTEIDRLATLEKMHARNIETLEIDREKLAAEMDLLKNDLEKEKITASKNEDDMINEILQLEETINKNILLQKEKQIEIDALKTELERLENSRLKGARAKKRGLDSTQKRFKALYKNVIISDRAIDGFLDLTEDMKIKAEEIIHKLNDNPSVVQIKRKVFGKKNRKTVQEVIFAYKGRLYFHADKDQKINILTIGTKNTQQKDLEYIDSL